MYVQTKAKLLNELIVLRSALKICSALEICPGISPGDAIWFRLNQVHELSS